MNRKSFLKKISLGLIVTTIPSMIQAEDKVMLKENFIFQNLNEVLLYLKDNKNNLSSIETKGQWKLGHILSHCAQSIEYSLGGYPDDKSKIFQWTAGSIAFLVFSLRGKMSHGLNEPIPGASHISEDVTIEEGIKRLELAIGHFGSASDADLKPHFAYGSLEKKDYDYAHTLHINNHFEELVL